jgi:signal transduction histidine kinase
VDHSIDLISEAITDLRDISRSLNSELIQNQGLLKALEMETKRISRSAHIAIDLSIRGEPVYLSCEKEIFIFRIIQEALNNVVKHAKASSVNLDLFYADQQVEINVKDNGIGFNKEGLLTTNGCSAGLSNMENRARLFNGKFSINSEKEKGTELNIVLPFA